MRRIALIATLLAATAAALAASAGADDSHTYKIEMYNAFGIVEGSDVRVAGVNAGTVKDLDINADKRAEVTVELSGPLSQLGEDTTCSSEPQSLIAEYFIDCEPKGPPLADEGTIPASQVTQTVQNDLVQNTLRQPFKQRLQLLINEFGTAVAGNADNLNEAIRLGAPSLRELRKVTRILADQNRIIRGLNVNSDQIIGRLTERQEDVVRFIQEARDTAAASASRREDLSRDFQILDDFLFELRPTLAELGNLAREQTPLLTDLRAAVPGLNRLVGAGPHAKPKRTHDLLEFSRAARGSLDTLGKASVAGRRALHRGRDEIKALAKAGKRAPAVSEILMDLLRDLDDPRRAVEINDNAATDTGRTNPEAGQRDTKGYTGLEGLLNYAYVQTGAINQFDQVGHLLHVNLYQIFSGPCGSFSTGHDPANNGAPGVPAENAVPQAEFPPTPDYSAQTIFEADQCVAWLGPNQPGINRDLGLPPYDDSVCPNGTEPQHAEDTLCPGPATTSAPERRRAAGGGGAGGEAQATTGPAPQAGAERPGTQAPSVPEIPKGRLPDDVLKDLLDLPKSVLRDLPDRVQKQLRDVLRSKRHGGGGGGLLDALGGGAGDTSGGGAVGGVGQATEDLLDFLLGP
jgi:phospholipid/cholesterol/gamma-HCH transport system substrate-binding protein